MEYFHPAFTAYHYARLCLGQDFEMSKSTEFHMSQHLLCNLKIQTLSGPRKSVLNRVGPDFWSENMNQNVLLLREPTLEGSTVVAKKLLSLVSSSMALPLH